MRGLPRTRARLRTLLRTPHRAEHSARRHPRPRAWLRGSLPAAPVHRPERTAPQHVARCGQDPARRGGHRQRHVVRHDGPPGPVEGPQAIRGRGGALPPRPLGAVAAFPAQLASRGRRRRPCDERIHPWRRGQECGYREAHHTGGCRECQRKRDSKRWRPTGGMRCGTPGTRIGRGRDATQRWSCSRSWRMRSTTCCCGERTTQRCRSRWWKRSNRWA